MPEFCITSQNIEKIGHPVREIRERALLSLCSKLDCDYVFDDNLNRSCELLKLLFRWFQYEECRYQNKVLKLLINIIKSDAGRILIKHYGCKRLLDDFKSIESKVDDDQLNYFNNMMDYLREQQPSNEETISIPELDLPGSMESLVGANYSSDESEKNIDVNKSKERRDENLNAGDILNVLDDKKTFDLSSQGVQVYLLPWCYLCESDMAIIKMIEDTFGMEESTERTTNFLGNILLRDFPLELFFNRPCIINNLLKILNNLYKCNLALEGLKNVYKAVHRKLSELRDPDIRCENKYTSAEIHFMNFPGKRSIDPSLSNIEDQIMKIHIDGEEALNQIPLPIFCLDTMYIVINLIGEFAIQPLPPKEGKNSYTMHEINNAVSLCFDAFQVLDEIIEKNMWRQECPNVFIERIYQKAVILMRSLGDVLKRLRLCSTSLQSKDSSFRVIYIRLLSLGILVTKWCDYSPLVPSSLTSSLYEGLFDMSTKLLYTHLHNQLKHVVQNVSKMSIQDKEKFTSYMDCKYIYNAMCSAVDFIQNYSTLCENQNVIKLIRSSLPALAFHSNITFIARVMDVFSVKCLKWKPNKSVSDDMRFITLSLLAHSDQKLQEAFYTMVYSLVARILGGDDKDASCKFNENSLNFLLESAIFIEIASHGIGSSNKKVHNCAKDIIQYMLRGKLLLTNKCWRLVLEALLPSLPFIHVHADHNDRFGSAVIKTLDLNICEQMLIPKVDLILGNIRLLYTKSFSAQMEGASNLISLLRLQDGSDALLPKIDGLRSDILCSTIRPLPASNFNIIKRNDVAFYEKGSLLQVLSLLSNYKSPLNDNDNSVDSGSIDPTFRRSALAQLAVMLQQPTLHESFLTNHGIKIITHYLRSSLTTHEYTSFPESAISCVTIFNILSYCNGTIRQWLSEQQDVILNIIRTLLIFLNDETLPTVASQVLGLVAFAQMTNNTPGYNSPNSEKFSGLSIHHHIAKNVNLPYPYETYSEQSPHQRYDKSDVLMSGEDTSSFLRIGWCSAWFGGVDNVVRWPYISEDRELQESFSKSLMINANDLSILKTTCPVEGCMLALYQIQNATSHKAVNSSLDMLAGYMSLITECSIEGNNLDHLPWQETLSRFTKSIPASPKDTSLLLNVIKSLHVYLDMLIKCDCENQVLIDWISVCIFDTSCGITLLLRQHETEKNWTYDCVDETVNNLRQSIIELICKHCEMARKLLFRHLPHGNMWKYEDLVHFLTMCLKDIEIHNHYSLAFIGHILRCLSHIIGISLDISTSCLSFLIQFLTEILTISFLGNGYEGYKNSDLVRNSFVILCQLLQNSLGDENRMKIWIQYGVEDKGDRNILSACLLWHNSRHVIIRCLAFKLLAGLCTQPPITSHLNQKFENANQNLIEIVVRRVLDNGEASLFREQVAILLSNLLVSKLVRQIATSYFNSNFFERISSTVTKVCIEDKEKYKLDNNIPLELLSNREALEVAYAKDEFTIPIILLPSASPKCSIKLLTAFTDMIYNFILYSEKIPDSLVQSGILRFLFRCITLKATNTTDKYVMITAICRLLHRAVNMSLHLHSTIVNTEHCVNALFDLYSSQDTESHKEDNDGSPIIKEMWKWSLYLIGSIAETKNGFKLLWKLLMQSGLSNFFKIILLSIRNVHYKEVLPSALFCLVNLFSSHILYDQQDSHSISIQKVLDETSTSSLDIKSVVNNSYNMQECDVENVEEDEFVKRTSVRFDAKKTVVEDAVLGEDLCDALLVLYQSLYNSCKNVGFPSVNDNPCYAVISCLCGLFATCEKAQLYAVDRGFIQQHIKILYDLHYSLAAEVKGSDIHKKSTHPSLLQLDWAIQLLCNLMTNCPQAKEQCAESGLIIPLNKSWPWCISSLELRHHTVQLLCVYTNDCMKANQSIHTSIGAKSLLQEVIDLIDKEMALVSRQRSLLVLRGCLQVLENVCTHVHCRSIILKSDLLNHLNKLHPAVTKRQSQWKEVESMWESFLITVSRHSEGQLKVAEYLSAICALIHQAQGLMLPVLGNIAFNPFNRPRILGSAEVINIFSTILLSNNNLQDLLIVCGALWAVGANHHKSKLSLKTAGLTMKLSERLQMMKYNNPQGSMESERAIQIITYVLKTITVV